MTRFVHENESDERDSECGVCDPLDVKAAAWKSAAELATCPDVSEQEFGEIVNLESEDVIVCDPSGSIEDGVNGAEVCAMSLKEELEFAAAQQSRTVAIGDVEEPAAAKQRELDELTINKGSGDEKSSEDRKPVEVKAERSVEANEDSENENKFGNKSRVSRDKEETEHEGRENEGECSKDTDEAETGARNKYFTETGEEV